MSDDSVHYVWDSFEVRPAARVLRRDGVDVPLEPKAYDVLVYLIKHRDRVVSKDELLEQLWPGRVVGDATVNQCLLKIRQAIDEDRNHSIIQTVRGRGFRFRPSVRVDTAAASKTASRFQPHHRIVVGMAIIVGLALLAWSGITYKDSVWVEPSTIAVMRFSNVSSIEDQDWLELGLMSLVSDSLHDYPDLNVVPSGTVARLLLNSPATTEHEDLGQLRSGIDARYVVSADVEALSEGYRLHYTLWDDDEPVWRDSIGGTDVGDLVTSLSGAVGDHLAQERRSAIPGERLSRIAFVNELFARGRQASLEGSYGQALRYLELALKEDPGLLYAEDDFARTLRLQGELDRSRAVTEGVIAKARARKDIVVEASATANLGSVFWRQGNHARGEELVSQALTMHQAMGDNIEAANDLNLLGILAGQQNRAEEAQGYYDEALVLFESAGDRRGIAKTYNNMAYLAGSVRDHNRSRAMNLRALEVQQELHLTGSMALTLNNLGVSSAALGDFSGALDYYQQALNLRVELEDIPGQLTSLGNVGSAYAALGKSKEAIDHTRRAVALAETLESPRNEALARLKLGEAYSGAQDTDAALAEFLLAKKLYADLGLEASVLEATLFQADLEQASGRTQDALATLGSAEEIIVRTELPGLAAWHQCITARLLLGTGDGPGALNAIEKGIDLAKAAGDERTLAELAIAGVWLHVRGNDLPQARRFADRIKQWQEQFFPAATAFARLAYSEGDWDRAVREQQRAKAMAGSRWSESEQAYLMAYEEAAELGQAVALPEASL